MALGGNTVENVNARFTADTGGFDKGVKSVKSGLASIAKAAGLIGGITGFVLLSKKAMGLSSDLVEVQNVVDTVFGDMSEKINIFAKNTLDSFGLSELSAKEYASAMGAALKSSGMDIKNALKMSTNLTALTGDIASFYNKSAKDVNDDLFSGIISGQIVTLRKYGIELSEVNLKNYALSQGITKAYSAMSSAEKIALRYNYVLSVTKDAQGDFAKTSGTFANQIKLLSENWNIFLSNLGGVFISVVTPVIQGLNWLLKAVNTVFTAFARFFALLTGKGASGAVESQKNLNEAIGGGTSALGDNTAASKGNAKAKNAEKKAQDKLNTSFDQFNDITPKEETDTASGGGGSGGTGGGGGGGIGDIGNLTDAYNFDFGMVEPDISWVDGFINKLSELSNLTIVQDIQDIFSEVGKILNGVWDEVKPNFESGFSNLFKGLGAIGSVLWNDVVLGLGGDFISTLLSWFVTNGPTIQANLATNLNNIFSGVFSMGNVFGNIAEILSSAIENAKPAIVSAFASMVEASYSVWDTSNYIITDSFAKTWDFIDNWVSTRKPELVKAMTGFFTESAQTSKLFSTIIKDNFDELKDFWTRWGEDILLIILNPLSLLGDMVLEAWNNLVAPVWDTIVEWLKKLWDETLSGLVEQVLGFIGRLGEVFNMIWGVLEPILKLLWTKLVNGFKWGFDLIIGIVMPVIQTIIEVIKSIIIALNGVLDMIIGVFTLDWNRAWEGIKDTFSGIWDSIKNILKANVNIVIQVVESLINFVIEGINKFLRGINALINGVNNIPGINIPVITEISSVKLPRLAKGGLAYGEINAVVGDNFNARQDPEVVSPLSSLKNIMLEAMVQKEIISGGSQDIKITLTLENGETLAEMLIDPMNNKAKNLGYNPVFAPV